MKSHTDSAISAAKAAIQATGARVTHARVRVLNALQSAPKPLSHGDIENSLNKESAPAMDRVTLYRVLDWLVDVELAHRAVDKRGVFQFSAANPAGKHSSHAHLRCTGCGGVFCLNIRTPSPPKLPRGFRFGGMSLDIHGECPHCVHSKSI